MFLRIAGLIISTLLAVTLLYGTDPVSAQGCADIQSTETAINDPDRYAWELFVALSQPGDLETKCPDSSKEFGADGPVLWETWRNVRPDAADSVFPPNGADPGDWLSGTAPGVRKLSDQENRSLKQVTRATETARTTGRGLSISFDPAVGEFNEVRMNRAAYEFVRSNRLYDKDVLVAAARSGSTSLQFPLAAKEIKAQWRRIEASQRARYHWTVLERDDGEREIWGLTSLHITTKDLPNWFWATFEHIDNKPRREATATTSENEGWLLPSVDRYSCPTSPHDCDFVPTGLGLQGTKWENYRLRGTQVDFVSSTGEPLALANSQIEIGFQTRSSCVSCHALAFYNRDGRNIGFPAFLGPPEPRDFRDPGGQPVMQTDFVWTLAIRPSSSGGGSP